MDDKVTKILEAFGVPDELERHATWLVEHNPNAPVEELVGILVSDVVTGLSKVQRA